MTEKPAEPGQSLLGTYSEVHVISAIASAIQACRNEYLEPVAITVSSDVAREIEAVTTQSMNRGYKEDVVFQVAPGAITDIFDLPLYEQRKAPSGFSINVVPRRAGP